MIIVVRYISEVLVRIRHLSKLCAISALRTFRDVDGDSIDDMKRRYFSCPMKIR